MRWLPGCGAAAAFFLTTTAWAQVPAGFEFRVNSYTSWLQRNRGLAVEPDGDFIVAWASLNQDGDGGGIFAQRFNADGTFRGGEFRVNTQTTGSQAHPTVTLRPNGDFVVVWDRTGSGPFPDVIVYGRRYDSSGAPRGDQFQLNGQAAGYPSRPRAAFNEHGQFLVVWTKKGAVLPFNDIGARLFDNSGALTSDFRINTATSGSHSLSDVAALAGGGFVAVWQATQGSYGNGAILGARLANDGTPLGADFRINDEPAGQWATWPSVSAAPGGGFVVVWTHSYAFAAPDDARGRRYDSTGSPLGPSFLVHSGFEGDQFVEDYRHVAHDEGGNFVVTWQVYTLDADRSSVFAQRFDGLGLRRGPEFRVNTYTTGWQMEGTVASDPVGNFVVVWNGAVNDREIYGQRFGGLFPRGLRVDTAGNGVWEPGESVDVRPTWRNLNGAPQNPAGTLSGLAGPPAATYAITDASGTYGTIPNGAAVEAGDFYGVSVNDPPSRPALHWDVSALEILSPDVMGQNKRWALHIGGSFTDVPRSSSWYPFVEALLHHGVTTGCGGTQYCPASVATRQEMAAFVLAAREGGAYLARACATPLFADVPASSPFCPWIEELARRGVVSGCGGGNYCPSAAVSREQMAVFVLRTLDANLNPPSCSTPVFNDVPASSPFCRWIEELARRGIVSGCGGGNYCPTAPVTREQMSVFLTGTFGLKMYGP